MANKTDSIVVNNSIQLKDLDGSVLKNGENIFTTGSIIGRILTNNPTVGGGDPLKLFSLGLKFANEKQITLDLSDFELVKKAVKETNSFTVLVSGQILAYLATLS